MEQQPIIWDHTPKVVKMPDTAKQRANKVVSLVREMKKNHRVIYINKYPYCYASFPEFVVAINKYYPMNLGDVWAKLSVDLNDIQSKRLKYVGSYFNFSE